VKILVLDDNADALLVISSFLKALDHEVSSYTDSREALLWLNDVKPEVIVCDLDMPNMDGFQFLKRVRCYGRFAAIPFICMTGTDTSDEVIKEAGFSAILRKPVTLSDVMDCVETTTAPVAVEVDSYVTHDSATLEPQLEIPTMAQLMDAPEELEKEGKLDVQ
jgi:CheY-like chemotaxis protein